MWFLTSLGLLALVSAVGASFVARHYWWAELATHFAVHIWVLAGVLIVLFIVQSRWKAVGISFLIFAWHTYLVFPLFFAEQYPLPPDVNASSPKATRILQYNLHYTDTDVQERVNWVLKQAPNMDVIVLLEVSDHHALLLQQLEAQFPYHFIKPMREYRGVAVFSKLANSEFALRDTEDKSTHYVVMNANSKSDAMPLSMFVIHPPPPISIETANERNTYFAQVTTEIQSNSSPNKILVGDFNMTRFSPYFRDLQNKTSMEDSFEGFGLQETWPGWLPRYLRITIDNLLVYVNPAATTRMATLNKEVGPANGSDHYPVITTLY